MEKYSIKSCDYYYRYYYLTCNLQPCTLRGHPLLSGQLSKSRKLLPLITGIFTFIKRSPLLSPNKLFVLSWPVFNGHTMSTTCLYSFK